VNPTDENPPRQWSAADLAAASQRGDHAAIVAAQDAGLLAELIANPGTAAQGAPRNV